MSTTDSDPRPDEKQVSDGERDAAAKKLEQIALELASRKLEIRKVDERITLSETNVFDK